MTPLLNAVACLLSLSCATFLWRGSLTFGRESLKLVGFLLVAVAYTYLASNMSDPAMELYPFRMVALGLCFSTTSLPNKRRRYLVLSQVFWLWIELFGGISLFYRGLEMPWTRIAALGGMASGSIFLSRISKEMEFCLVVFWIAVWVFF